MKFVSILLSLLLSGAIAAAGESGKEKVVAGTVALVAGVALNRQAAVYSGRAASRSSAIQSRKAGKFELGSAACFVASTLFFASHIVDVQMDEDSVVVTKKVKF